MALVETRRAQDTVRFWKASLAWKNIGTWARGWTQEDFIEECRYLCLDPSKLGDSADELLDSMIHDRERIHLETPGVIISLWRDKTRVQSLETHILSQQA